MDPSPEKAIELCETLSNEIRGSKKLRGIYK